MLSDCYLSLMKKGNHGSLLVMMTVDGYNSQSHWRLVLGRGLNVLS